MNFKYVSQKFLEFQQSNNYFSSQKCPKDRGRVKVQRKPDDVSYLNHLSLFLVITLCFVELHDVTDCNEGITK